jgi:hypothetical protein
MRSTSIIQNSKTIKSMMLPTLAFLAATGAAFGQLTGPVLGYLPDGSSLRAINGIPAAASVGPAVTADINLGLIQVAPNQPFALATAYSSGAALLVTPSAGGAGLQMVPVNAAAAGATKIVFSPNGTAAGLWFSSTGHLQILTGLASTIAVRDIDASSLGGDPGALAVSDDGQWAVGSWAAKIYALGASAQPTVLPVQGPAEALNFLHASDTAAIITATEVVTVAGIGSVPAPTVVWSLPAGASPSPNAPVAVGIAATADNSVLAIAANTGALFTLNLATGAGTPADCGCKPIGLFGLGGAVFRLTGISTGPLKLFDASSNDVWFVPLAAAPSVAGGQQ